jgi:hypothetical protein
VREQSSADLKAGNVTASHFSMNCLKPAVGRRFVAKGITVRAGRKQIFAKAELYSENEQGDRTLVATGDTLMVPLEAEALFRGMAHRADNVSNGEPLQVGKTVGAAYLMCNASPRRAGS